MLNSRNVPANNGISKAKRLHATGRETLTMSVIVEEPVSMRESRLEEHQKHPNDIKPSDDCLKAPQGLVERSTAHGSNRSLASPPGSPACRSSEPASSLRAATISLSEEYPNSRTLQSEQHSCRVESRRSLSSETCTRHHDSPTNDPRSNPSYEQHSFDQMCSDLESALHLEPSNSSSLKDKEKSNNDQQRPSGLTSARPKTSSYPLKRQVEHCDPNEQNQKSETTSIYSPSSADVDDVYVKEKKRRGSRERCSSREKCSSKSIPSSSSKLTHKKRQMPPFRGRNRPIDGETGQSSSPSELKVSSADHARGKYRLRSRHAGREHLSSPPHAHVSHSESEAYEDHRERAFRGFSPPSRQRSTSSPKKRISHTSVRARRQSTSCRQSKAPVMLEPTLLHPANSRKYKAKASAHPFPSSQDPSRARSITLPSKKISRRSSSEEPITRSSSISSISSTPSPRISASESPLRLRHYEGRFPNRRRQTLFYFSLFPPEKMSMRGVVLYLHGIGDHCRRNVTFYERLCREGFGVITYDLLNHGVSDLDQHKTRGHISEFNNLVEDTNDFITFAKRSIFINALKYWREHQHRRGKDDTDKSSQAEIPLIIAGTSFGSLIGVHTILSGQHKFHAAVWCSPILVVTWNPLLWAESKLAKSLSAIIPKMKIGPIVQLDLLSRDPKFLKRLKADPLTSMDMLTARTEHEALQAMKQLQEDTRVTDPSSAFCAIPMLFLAGSADSVYDQQTSIKFFGTMGNFDKEFKLFDGLYHLVYEEPEKEDVFRYLVKWLHRRFHITD